MTLLLDRAGPSDATDISFVPLAHEPEIASQMKMIGPGEDVVPINLAGSLRGFIGSV